MASAIRLPDPRSAFAGRRILLTGHTGFKGSWLTRWLLDMGAEVTGLALEPDSSPALFAEMLLAHHMDSRIGDIRDSERVARVFAEVRPEVVFHLAAQPAVLRSYAEPRYTFDTNVMGTVNVLEAVRSSTETRAVVNVTTDKVYENPETGEAFVEESILGGRDPYSASKACSEIVSASYRRSFLSDGGAAIATARSGNVIGGGDWSNDRIIPDVVRALAVGEPVRIRRPETIRPWQHVLEPLAGYLSLAAALLERGQEFADAFNFGPEPEDVHTVRELVECALGAWGAGEWDVPDSGEAPYEAGMLVLDIAKAKRELGWRPVWDFQTAVERTVTWYQRVGEGESPTDVTRDDLAAYTAAMGA
ncbi:MAG: CDP-glucose 4,6-dehydratase [Coriobacteriia bacterium]|nr:CDP-glucose 4,6-dehydratase [Coriobacteriia bacterium]